MPDNQEHNPAKQDAGECPHEELGELELPLRQVRRAVVDTLSGSVQSSGWGGFTGQEPGPLRWAAVEAGKMGGGVRP